MSDTHIMSGMSEEQNSPNCTRCMNFVQISGPSGQCEFSNDHTEQTSWTYAIVGVKRSVYGCDMCLKGPFYEINSCAAGCGFDVCDSCLVKIDRIAATKTSNDDTSVPTDV